MNKTLWERIWETRTGYLMVVPTLAFLLIFQYYPAVSGLYRSLFDWNAGLEGTFIGLANFIELFTDDEVFIRSLRKYGPVDDLVPVRLRGAFYRCRSPDPPHSPMMAPNISSASS